MAGKGDWIQELDLPDWAKSMVSRVVHADNGGDIPSVSDAELDEWEGRLSALPHDADRRLGDTSGGRRSDEVTWTTIAIFSIRNERHSRARKALEAVTVTRIQETPIPLYRSVSPDELVDIMRRGSVTGRLNIWTEKDRRRVVLFADCATLHVLIQGEDIYRRVDFDLMDHPLKRSMDEAAARAKVSPECPRAASDAREAQGRYRSHHDDLRREREKAAEGLTWTSALIRTVPIAGATVWPHGHRLNMMGRIDEYGMETGAVTVDHIEEVSLIRKRQVIWKGTLEEARLVLTDLGDLEPEPAGPGPVAADAAVTDQAGAMVLA